MQALEAMHGKLHVLLQGQTDRAEKILKCPEVGIHQAKVSKMLEYARAVQTRPVIFSTERYWIQQA